MLSLHFNKQVFINALKANNNLVTFLSTTFALLLTLVMIGSSETRAIARGDGGTWVYTPRGYAAKHLDDKSP